MSYFPHTQQDIKEMLAAIGKNSLEELFEDIPLNLKMKGEYAIPSSLCEPELVRFMQQLAEKNKGTDKANSFLGAGVYEHFIPVLVDFLSSRGEFSTSYTPYQPEVSQGNLQAIFEYQTAITEITQLDVSNASLYDGATALAEALLLSYSHHRRKRNVFLLPANLHPEYRQVVHTYMQNLDVKIVEIPEKDGLIDSERLASLLDDKVASVVVASPNFFGLVEDAAAITSLAHKSGALSIVLVNPVSLGVLTPPGAYDADIAVGEGQPLGIPLSYGGPYFGFMAAKQEFLREMPGRIAGQTVDGRGERGFVLTIQTREQHIRREKATSNICSNQALMALRGLMYLTCLGKEGFYEVACQCLQKAHYLAKCIAQVPGYSLTYSGPFFHEFVVKCPKSAGETLESLQKRGIYGGVALEKWFPERKNEILVAVTECKTYQEITSLVNALREI